MVLQNYQNLIEMTSNIIDIVAFGVGFKCPRKIHLNTPLGSYGPLLQPPYWASSLNFQVQQYPARLSDIQIVASGLKWIHQCSLRTDLKVRLTKEGFASYFLSYRMHVKTKIKVLRMYCLTYIETNWIFGLASFEALCTRSPCKNCGLFPGSNFEIAISFHSSIFGKMGKKLEKNRRNK